MTAQVNSHHKGSRLSGQLWVALVLSLLAGIFSGTALSQPQKLSQHDAITALKQVAYAGRSLNFTGIFVLQKGGSFRNVSYHASRRWKPRVREDRAHGREPPRNHTDK
jgi:negative regulator of sigma E activity